MKMHSPECLAKKIPTYDLRFAKMGHGEAIIFPIGNEYYLRDFGAFSPDRINDKPHCSLMKLAEKIFKRDYNCCLLCGCNDKMLNAILSHSHRDHYNGFKKLFEMRQDKEPIFSKVYLPCKCRDQKEWTTYAKLIESNVIVFCLCNDTELKENIKNFLTADLVMRAISQEVTYCCYTQSVELPFKCLSPKISLVEDDNSLFYKLQSNIVKIKNICKNEIDWEKIHKISSIICGIHEKYLFSSQKDFQRNSISEDIDRINSCLDEGCQQKFCLRLIKQSSQFYSLLKGNEDSCSLIIDAKIGNENTMRWLFLGDQYDQALKKILPCLEKQYDGIKSAHHGTRCGKILFSPIFDIKTKIVMHCTGIGHGKLKLPDKRYSLSGSQCYANGFPCNKTAMDITNLGIILQDEPCIMFSSNDFSINCECCRECNAQHPNSVQDKQKEIQ